MKFNIFLNVATHLISILNTFRECEYNKNGIDVPLFDAEFGYILYQHVPKVYTMCKKKKLREVNICKGMRPFYYFLDKNMITQHKCSLSKSINIENQHKPHNYMNPDFSPFIYKTEPYFYIFNKHNTEWSKPPINTFLPDDLDLIFKEFCFPAIYHRAKNTPELGVAGNDTLQGDYEIAAHHKVSVTTSLFNKNVEIMNTLQILLAKNAYFVIGVQGGMATLASMVSSKAVFFCKSGSECYNDFHFYPEKHNSSLIITNEIGSIPRFIKKTCKKPYYLHIYRK